MKNFTFLLLIIITGTQISLSQPDIKSINGILSNLNNSVLENNLNPDFKQNPNNYLNQFPVSGIEQLLNKHDFIKSEISNKKYLPNKLQSKDTLFIGMQDNDSLVVTGDWTYYGTIVIVLNGKLIFKNANATIFGDIIMMHNGILEATDSKIYMPQQYFYQRTIMGVHNSQFIATNSSFDYSGLSHNLVLMDSTKFDFKHIKVNGFTTTGVYGKPTFNIDDINEAGEFVVSDNSIVNIKNSKTALIWHVIPKGGKLYIEFPKGDSLLPSYICNKSINGISGINYNINLQNITNVMWGIMPQPGSDVKITNSHLRTIGLWFTENESTTTNSLVNNSIYQDFNFPGGERSLKLINTSVDTWSIYCFNNSNISLNSSIVGEIGTMGKSKISVSKVFCDGSGGYIFANDTSFILFGYGAATTAIRSTSNSILIFAYSSLMGGQSDAFGNSVMVLIQSQFSEPIAAHDASTIFFLRIESPNISSVDSKVPVIGSVWLETGTDGSPFKFDSYSLFYKTNTESIWHPIIEHATKEKRSDTLAVWDTKSLSPENYILRLVLYHNFNDSMEALRAVNVQPKIVRVNENIEEIINIYPNPANDYIEIDNGIESNLSKIKSIEIIDFHGIKIYQNNFPQINKIDVSNFQNGIYFLKINSSDGEIIKKFEICK
jgi:hypothetical protein